MIDLVLIDTTEIKERQEKTRTEKRTKKDNNRKKTKDCSFWQEFGEPPSSFS